MVFQEYPKALYCMGEYRAVNDASEEQIARDEDFTDWTADYERLLAQENAPVKRGPGRPKKIQAEA